VLGIKDSIFPDLFLPVDPHHLPIPGLALVA